MKPLIIAPSILSSNFSKVGEEVAAVDQAGADWIHLDVMDGHFVPALTFGPALIKSIRDRSRKFFDAHLMISNPDEHLEAYAEAGCDGITVHCEACPHLDRTLEKIRSLGKKTGVAVNPATPVDFLPYVVEKLDLVLVMTVNPGFGGQKYLPLTESKMAKVAEATEGRNIEIQVDGGVTDQTIKTAKAAGANNFVAGSYIFGGDYAERIQNLRKSCQ